MAFLFYPRVYNITDIIEVVENKSWGFFADDSLTYLVKPKVTHASKDKVNSYNAYLLDNGEYINLYVGSHVP